MKKDSLGMTVSSSLERSIAEQTYSNFSYLKASLALATVVDSAFLSPEILSHTYSIAPSLLPSSGSLNPLTKAV